MGQSLVIKNADFSNDRIGVVNLEPVNYISCKVGNGAASVGELYINIGDGQSSYSIQRKVSPSSGVRVDFDSGTIIKVLPGGSFISQGGYYLTLDDDNKPFYLIGFGLEKLGDFGNTVYKYENGQIIETTINNWKGFKTNLKAGETIVYPQFGGSGPKALVVEDASGNLTVVDSTIGDFYPREYTATEDCIVYLNSNASNNPWVAKKV